MASFFRKLPRYVRLVDQVLLSSLVKLSRTSIIDFVHSSMKAGPEAPREALFKSFLVFSKKTGTSLFVNE